MSNCELKGMDLFELSHKTDNNMLLSVPGNKFHGNLKQLKFSFCQVHSVSSLISMTANSEEVWYWTGGNAINNEFIWLWFSTGVEIARDFSSRMEVEPKQGFDQIYQTFVGCAAIND
jgi:hypothetical protein